MMSLRELLEDHKLLTRVFDEIDGIVSHTIKKDIINIKELGLEYFTISVRKADLRKGYYDSELGLEKGDEAHFYVYSNSIDPKTLSGETIFYQSKHYGINSTFRVRIYVILNFRTREITTDTVLITNFPVPMIQHIPFPIKDNSGKWFFDFFPNGNLTKAAR